MNLQALHEPRSIGRVFLGRLRKGDGRGGQNGEECDETSVAVQIHTRFDDPATSAVWASRRR
jgi:hypothetical protein